MGLFQYALIHIYPHFPALRILTVVIPLLLQAALLQPCQTSSTRLARAALTPLGLYFSTFIILDPACDFQPRDAYRAVNFIKNVSFTLVLVRTLEYGLVKDKYEWIGYDAALAGNKPSKSTLAKSEKTRPSPHIEAWPVAMCKQAVMTMSTYGIGCSAIRTLLTAGTQLTGHRLELGHHGQADSSTFRSTNILLVESEDIHTISLPTHCKYIVMSAIHTQCRKGLFGNIRHHGRALPTTRLAAVAGCNVRLRCMEFP